MARLIKTIVLLLLFLSGAVFAMINAQSVEFNYYFGVITMPLSLAMVIAMALGTLLGIMASLGAVLKAKRQASSLRKTVSAAEKELSNLRLTPPKEKH